MTNLRKFEKTKKLREELKLRKQELSDWLNETDMKKLIARFFVDGFKARIFPPHLKEHDELHIMFEFGPYEFRLQRRKKQLRK